MAILPILTAPDPRLNRHCSDVEAVDDDIRRLLDDMRETMYDAPGIGLAAIQVDVAKRVVVIDLAREGEDPDPHYFINPEIYWQSDDLAVYEEGCLSVPEFYEDVERPAECKLRYLDYDGKKQDLHATGLMATCIQHEIDHLDGTLFIDHLSKLKKAMILKKLRKARRLASAD